MQDKLYGHESSDVIDTLREILLKHYECDTIVFDTWVDFYGFPRGYIVMRFKNDRPGYYTYSSWEFSDLESTYLNYVKDSKDV